MEFFELAMRACLPSHMRFSPWVLLDSTMKATPEETQQLKDAVEARYGAEGVDGMFNTSIVVKRCDGIFMLRRATWDSGYYDTYVSAREVAAAIREGAV